MTRQTLLAGTAVLVAASLFNRILGFTYQILIIKLIGAQGIGIYNMVFPIYILSIVIASAGIPLAVARFVAAESSRKNYAGVRRILWISLTFLFATGLLTTVLLYLLVPFLRDHVFPNPDAFVVFRVLLPGILVISVSSVFRGYFQGLMQMTPTAVSQVAEQVVRVVFGLLLARFFLPAGIQYAAMGSAIGTIIGEFVSLAFLGGLYLRHVSHIPKGISVRLPSYGRLLGDMLTFSIPVSLSRILATVILSLEATIIPRQLLAAGHSLAEATSMYGQLTGMALPILAIPSVLTASLATAMVPAVSAAHAAGQVNALNERITDALKITMIGGLPAVALFIMIPGELTNILFHNYQAGQALRILAVGGLFYYMQQTTTSILQGLGRANLPLRNLLIASVLELLGLVLLVDIPGIGLAGAAWAINISFIVTASLNFVDIVRLVGLTLSISELFVRPLGITLFMVAVLLGVYRSLLLLEYTYTHALLLSLSMAGLSYLLLLLGSGLLPPTILKRISLQRMWQKIAR
ncbi:MAG TPA: stage V sporulation protein B [Bacillota bacterium]|nr:stage V sporulation protein B [Bacillota bacterium]